MRILACLLAVAIPASAASLVLKRTWVEQFKDRATIDATLTVDHAHPHPNPPANDGDMHVAGRAPEVGLPMVTEIMNAAAPTEKPAVDLVHQVEGSSTTIPVTGAWRLWFEHPPSTGSQIQFATVPPAANTNPDHCFEIHPLTKVGPTDLKGSLHDIAGFTPKDAAAAFGEYEKLSVSMVVSSTAVTLTSKKSGFNYVLFNLRVTAKSTPLKDGGMAIVADVMPADDTAESEPLATGVRMIFVPGTAPFQQASSGLKVGDEMK